MQQRKVKFERHASQVVFDPAMPAFVVTWAKCNRSVEERISEKKDLMSWVPSIDAVATLYDRGCVQSDQIVYAAMAIGRAWDLGDRDVLDTEEAKKAAELVRDLSCMCVNVNSSSVSRDIGQAMRHLLDEMAKVRFMNTSLSDLDEDKIMASLDKSSGECLSIDGFCSWPGQSMRRRFLYCLNRRERTPVAYTLASLIFDSGSCPLLSLSDRGTLRMQASRASGISEGMTAKSMSAFFRYAIMKMRGMSEEGKASLGERITQQQLSDIVSSSHE